MNISLGNFSSWYLSKDAEKLRPEREKKMEGLILVIKEPLVGVYFFLYKKKTPFVICSV